MLLVIWQRWWARRVKLVEGGRGCHPPDRACQPSTRTHGHAGHGKSVKKTSILIDRIHKGETVETWIDYDPLGTLQQLSIVPFLWPCFGYRP